MTNTFRHLLVAGIAAGCLAALTVSLIADAASMPGHLEALFARYDREPHGPAKEDLAARIDAVAHQKYATVSRLYWHTDLASARIAAAAHRRPILHLRMLGRLDEDLSCANSRLFRATLYANQEVSAFLRENFVLYWSSERPVPRVTIDYGDGRRLEWTTTGNSAHYILDERGDVLDALPGLYAPTAFRRELEGSLALAARVRGTSKDERALLVADYHRQRVVAATADWKRITAMPGIPGAGEWVTPPQGESELAAAQRRTFTKSGVEMRTLRYIAKELAPEEVSQGQVETWSVVGQVLYGIGDLRHIAISPIRAVVGSPVTVTLGRSRLLPSLRVLDESSRALIVRLHNMVPRELRATDDQGDAMIARLEKTILADTALNQLRLRPQISREIVRTGGRSDFDTLNAWIYAEVSRTPRRDAWLGLLPRTVFTALPGDGVVMR